ncbi:cob(I)yrinic acid a,c-diamide adenosyltransferase [Rariglobus hedericola]|uniref:Corrinoid adenosyltransferase n=1 Tax=Rariglobus hedericola TaxID=2597822 RepID=A0A556QKH2_9BACT|nr:cob(I)yrinic acid a,c-diamide adenosyltransferase [Rariglobus hedericola]TSJ77102.1 cob(I)yrinic acid a,c-diamide adenosyltransferase [Rariglobus hedericola]
MSSIATRTGDDGTTGFLYGQRVPKDHPQIEAVGAFDELNAAVGFAKATCADAARRTELERIQKDLVNLMGEIACAETDAARYAESEFPKLTDADLVRIDEAVAAVEAQNVRFDGWATPGANLHAAALDLARTTARRAERRLVGLPAQGRTVRPLLGHYINRVSDLLWLFARQAEM